MRKSFAALVLLVMPAAVLAQGGRGERGGRGFGPGGLGNPVEIVLQHKTELNLTADQVTKLEDVARKLEEQSKPIIAELEKERGNARPGELTEQQREQMRDAMEKLRDNREDAQKQVASILTDQQEEQLRSFRPARPEGMGGRGGRGGPGGFGPGGSDRFARRDPVEMILDHKSDLALTNDQVSKLEAISKKLEQEEAPIMEKLRAERGTGTRRGELTEQQRKEMREALDKLRDSREDAAKDAREVLTKDQQKKLESLRPERGFGRR